jgi:hypothetical protein
LKTTLIDVRRANRNRTGRPFEVDTHMKWNVCLLALVLAVFAEGCGGSSTPANRDPVYPVSGTIIYKGKPVPGADVTFICQEKDRAAFGRTDSNGEFQLTTFSSNDGAVAGKHTVVVTLIENVAPAKPEAPLDSPNYAPPTMADSLRAPKPKSGLPAKYSDVKTSDLVAVVNADGNNPPVKLELKD